MTCCGARTVSRTRDSSMPRSRNRCCAWENPSIRTPRLYHTPHQPANPGTLRLSPVTCRLSLVACPLSLVLWPLGHSATWSLGHWSLVTCHLSLVPCRLSLVHSSLASPSRLVQRPDLLGGEDAVVGADVVDKSGKIQFIACDISRAYR